MASKHVDFVVVGGGIAGCLMSEQLITKGKKILLYDDDASGSSQIAAGLINPITGRHFVKSWKIEVLIDCAKRLYSSLEARYGTQTIHPLHVLRSIKSNAMLNEWSARLKDENYTPYIISDNSEYTPSGIAKNYKELAIIQQVFRVDFDTLITSSKQFLESIDALRMARFDHNKISKKASHFEYEDCTFSHVIFCEGSFARHNPLWEKLEFVPAKGERLIISSPDLKLKDVYNDGKIIIPLGDDKYWVGSNYEWEQLDTEPTEKVYLELKAFLDKTLTVPYTIVNHSAHIRPSTYNRRPFVGRHPDHENFYILNGLGAKGASLAPYCVEQLINYILDGEELDEEIDVNRSKG